MFVEEILSEEQTKEMIACWEKLGNTPEELGELIAVATFPIPQRGWYSDKYCQSERLRINSAKYSLKLLPHGKLLLGE